MGASLALRLKQKQKLEMYSVCTLDVGSRHSTAGGGRGPRADQPGARASSLRFDDWQWQ